jgi:hypothetical protein
MKVLGVGCQGLCFSNDPNFHYFLFLISNLGYSFGVTSMETLNDAARFYTNIPERAEIRQHSAFNVVSVKANTISSLPAPSAKKH